MARTPTTAKTTPFPLWLHKGTGQWCRKVRGKFHYYGTDKDKALAEWVRVRDDLNAGRTPRPRAENELTVREACNRFLHFKRGRVVTGELSGSTWSQYHGACSRIVEQFGPGRAVADLRPTDFADLRAAAAKRLSARTLGQFTVLVRSVFEWCYQTEFIPVPVRYGSSFDRPARRLVRLDRKRKGPKLIEATDLRKMLTRADPQLKACILLGLNAAYGCSDCSRLNQDDLAAEPGWLSVSREKTGEDRRAQLWPETLTALSAANKVRPNPIDSADADAVFLTREGHRLVRHKDRSIDGKVVSRRDSLSDAFARLAKNCDVKLSGRFYLLRHQARTLMDERRDTPAARVVMGHSAGGIDREYVELITDERLVAVTEHVRQWLFA
jgi:integrase